MRLILCGVKSFECRGKENSTHLGENRLVMAKTAEVNHFPLIAIAQVRELIILVDFEKAIAQNDIVTLLADNLTFFFQFFKQTSHRYAGRSD